MKIALLIISAQFFVSSLWSQGVFANQTNKTLEKVVQNYPSQFRNIKGEQLPATGQAMEFKSTVFVPGTVSTTIRQSGADKENLSWQSVMFESNSFNLAKTKFEELYNEIKNSIIKPEAGKAVIVNGMYTEPNADKTYTTIQFDMMPTSAVLQKMSIDLTFDHSGKQYRVILSVYDREKKEAELASAK